MVDIQKLQAALKAKGISSDEAADCMGVDRATFYRRINRNGSKFTVDEVSRLSALLKLDSKDLQAIFFGQELA